MTVTACKGCVHKGVEHMTPDDAPRYVAVLDDNIAAAVRRRHEFTVWWKGISPYFTPAGRLLDALRERAARKRAAA